MPQPRIAACLLALLLACDDDEVSISDAGGGDAALATEERPSSLDVLFVVDNSLSMGTHQQRLGAAIPGFIERLSQRAQSLRVGVATTNVGGLQAVPDNASDLVRSCLGAGDDGRLQTSLVAARDGVEVICRDSFCAMPSTVLLPPDPACTLGAQPAYQQFTPTSTDARALQCVARVGVQGCPFEQPLEAALKALASADFLRADAALAVIVLTDEDDCSVTAAGRELFSLAADAETKLGPINLRCGKATEQADLLKPVDGYLNALRALKPGHPERVVFTAIAGVPANALALAPDAVLALPEMQFREDPQNLTFPKPVCEQAVPSIRLVRLARAFGANAVVGSVCGDDVAGALGRTADKLVPLLK
ncbi:MAG: hypothetical protein ABW352_10300 [Polyangiales bacterium]